MLSMNLSGSLFVKGYGGRDCEWISADMRRGKSQYKAKRRIGESVDIADGEVSEFGYNDGLPRGKLQLRTNIAKHRVPGIPFNKYNRHHPQL